MTTQNFEIRMTRDLDDLIAFTAFAKNLGEGGEPLTPRQKPQIAPDLIEKLQQGNAQPASIEQMKTLISNWLLGGDLKPPLETAIMNLNGDNIRLIFHIDDRLRKDAILGDLLADLPLELLVMPGDIVPLALNPKVSAFIHRLNRVPAAQTATMTHSPPLRVLMVHSNPPTLGGQVPNPSSIRKRIIELGKGLVEVDLLCSHDGEGVIGPPTRDGLWKAMANQYDILVYLGHGGREQLFEDLLPLSLIYLESPDGQKQDPVRADVLAARLLNNPVPVVLLVGCLTAAEVPAETLENLLAHMPAAMRGNQGMAQALVDSSSGVQVAVGMRYRLESEDACFFLEAFFDSLLASKPGNIEAAVHAAREKLHSFSNCTASFSGPVLYRVLSDEPMFDFLASPPQVMVNPLYQRVRNTIWKIFANLSWSNNEMLQTLTDALSKAEGDLVQDTLQRAPLLMPTWQLGKQNETVQMPLTLYGELNVDELEANLIVDSPDVDIESIVASNPVDAAGFSVLTKINRNRAYFRIQREQPGHSPLPAGTLMDVKLKLGPSNGVLYPVAIDVKKIHPKKLICPANNVVIVPTP
jgi:hypothetical protein